jgi:O-antigen/teichoic acid export membrane protein
MMHSSPTSYARTFAIGSTLNSAQWLVNKTATAAAMLLIARFLTPTEYGTSTQCLAIFQAVCIVSPLTVGDVLIAHPRRIMLLAQSAHGLALQIGLVMTLLLLGSIPIIVQIYPAYPAKWLIGLLAVLAVRPLVEAALMLPLTLTRISLAYRRMSIIDGSVQIVATCSSVIIAAAGGGPASMVVPQLLVPVGRSACYARHLPRQASKPFRWKLAGFLFRAFVRASGAQYLHNVIVMSEVLVLGLVSGDRETGYFGFAFTLACQANTVIAYQLGQTLQPVLGRLQDDIGRQVAGFLKVQRVLGAVCVPLCLAQATFAGPIFRLLLEPKWHAAMLVFQIISLAQGFYFATGPSMSCLRAQRRFGTFLGWQAVQLVLTLPAYWFGAKAGGAVGAAIASGIMWCVSSIVSVWLCARPARSISLFGGLMLSVRPWVLSLPIFTVVQFASVRLAAVGKWGDIGSLVLLGPMSVALAVWVNRFSHPDVRSFIDDLLARARTALARRGICNPNR